MSKSASRDVLLERTTDAEVFQDMDNFDLLNDATIFELSLRLQFPKFSKGFTANDFDPFVRSYVGEENIVSLGRLSFPNEWQMQVKSKAVRETLIRMGRTKINARTCWISPLSQSEVRGFIHWIPSAIPNTKLEEFLRLYGKVLLMENQKQSKWKIKVECDSRYFGLYLKSGKTMDDLPHFIRIGEYQGLVTIRGRSPCCFHCKQPGHRKSECKTYREKISDYCMRPPGMGARRLKPRGKRFRKHWQGKKVNQEVQTDTTCSECIKERLAAAENAEPAANIEGAECGDAEHPAAGDEVETSGAESNSVVDQSDMMLSLSAEDAKKPGFWRRVNDEKKRLKRAKKEELLALFKERVKEIDQGPLQQFADKMASLSATGGNIRKAQESAANENSDKDHSESALAQKAVVKKKSRVKDAEPEPNQLELLKALQKNIEDVLASTKEKLECAFEAAKQVVLENEAVMQTLLANEAAKQILPESEASEQTLPESEAAEQILSESNAEKPSAKKKRKRQKKKATVEPQVNN